MAARRLLIVLLVMLAVSSVMAAVVPEPEEPEPGTTAATEAEERKRDSPPGGRLIEATLHAERRSPETIRLRRGDQLALTVRSRVPDQVQIPAFGQVEDVQPYSPARFDLLPDLTGIFDVRLTEQGRTIGRISVGPRERDPLNSGDDRN